MTLTVLTLAQVKNLQGHLETQASELVQTRRKNENELARLENSINLLKKGNKKMQTELQEAKTDIAAKKTQITALQVMEVAQSNRLATLQTGFDQMDPTQVTFAKPKVPASKAKKTTRGFKPMHEIARSDGHETSSEADIPVVFPPDPQKLHEAFVNANPEINQNFHANKPPSRSQPLKGVIEDSQDQRSLKIARSQRSKPEIQDSQAKEAPVPRRGRPSPQSSQVQSQRSRSASQKTTLKASQYGISASQRSSQLDSQLRYIEDEEDEMLRTPLSSQVSQSAKKRSMGPLHQPPALAKKARLKSPESLADSHTQGSSRLLPLGRQTVQRIIGDLQAPPSPQLSTSTRRVSSAAKRKEKKMQEQFAKHAGKQTKSAQRRE